MGGPPAQLVPVQRDRHRCSSIPMDLTLDGGPRPLYSSRWGSPRGGVSHALEPHERRRKGGRVGMSGIRTMSAAELLGVSPRALRDWERRYGYPKPRRTPAGHREYDLAELEPLRQALMEAHSVVGRHRACAPARHLAELAGPAARGLRTVRRGPGRPRHGGEPHLPFRRALRRGGAPAGARHDGRQGELGGRVPVRLPLGDGLAVRRPPRVAARRPRPGRRAARLEHPPVGQLRCACRRSSWACAARACTRCCCAARCRPEGSRARSAGSIRWRW